MAEPVVLADRPAPHVARLLINRPHKRNAIDHDVRQTMLDLLGSVLADGGVRALVLGGVGGTFSAGGDLPSMGGLDEAGAGERMRHIHRLCRALAGAALPVVSAVEGACAGGAVGMALLGDEIVVGEDTKILFPFLSLGLTPDWGQLLTLPERVGRTAAWWMLTSGGPVSGAEALRTGLADQLTAQGSVMAAAVSRAEALARLPATALALTKRRLAIDPARLEAELGREARDQVSCLTGREFAEGFAAFAARRAPDFVADVRGVSDAARSG